MSSLESTAGSRVASSQSLRHRRSAGRMLPCSAASTPCRRCDPRLPANPMRAVGGRQLPRSRRPRAVDGGAGLPPRSRPAHKQCLDRRIGGSRHRLLRHRVPEIGAAIGSSADLLPIPRRSRRAVFCASIGMPGVGHAGTYSSLVGARRAHLGHECLGGLHGMFGFRPGGGASCPTPATHCGGSQEENRRAPQSDARIRCRNERIQSRGKASRRPQAVFAIAHGSAAGAHGFPGSKDTDG